MGGVVRKSAVLASGVAKPAKRRGRPFRPGESGNPRGKVRGTRNVTSLMLEALFDGEAEAIGRKAVELAKAGDGRALKVCLDRLLPAVRNRCVSFRLPPIDKAEDLPKASAALLAAVAAGEITPADASEIIKLIFAHRRLIEEDGPSDEPMSEYERKIRSIYDSPPMSQEEWNRAYLTPNPDGSYGSISKAP